MNLIYETQTYIDTDRILRKLYNSVSTLINVTPLCQAITRREMIWKWKHLVFWILIQLLD